MLTISQIIKFLGEKQERISSIKYNSIANFEYNMPHEKNLLDNVEILYNEDLNIEDLNKEDLNKEDLNKEYFNKKDFNKKDFNKKDLNFKKIYNYNLPQSFDIIFNKSITNFYYDNTLCVNKSNIFTFINSILLAINETFNLNKDNEKENIVKILVKKIDSELFELNLYSKFNYNKCRKFNKTDIVLSASGLSKVEIHSQY